MEHILMILGSARSRSFNTAMAKMAAAILNGKCQVKMLGIRDVPLFSQDDEFPTPEVVESARRDCRWADGIWIFTPEYNGAIPGGLKNLLDWLSRPAEPGGPRTSSALYGKPCTVSAAGGRNAGRSVREDVCRLALRLSMKVMDEPTAGIALSAQAFQSGNLSEEDQKTMQEQCERQADAFMKFIQTH